MVNLTGLDVTSRFIVRVEADNYYDRTIIIRSIYQTQRVYLLNQSVSAVENQFFLDDLTGQFGDDTKLIIQRPLTINGSTSYERIVGAEFGVAGHTTTLEQGVRYRMIVESDGRQRIVGSYFAESDGQITLEVGSIVYPRPESGGVAFEAEKIEEDGQEHIRVRYNDTDGLTERLQITVYERGNKSNVLTSYDQLDVQTVTLKPTIPDEDTSWVVNVTADRGDTTYAVTYPVGGDYRVPSPSTARGSEPSRWS